MVHKAKLCILVIAAICIIAWGSLPGSEAQSDKKVALLFLTVNEPNHSDLWKKIITDHRELCNVYVHSKYKMTHPFFAQFRIKYTIPNSWSIHAKAWQLLLKEAIKDKSNYKFVFLSESCVPLYPLDFIHWYLTQNDNTYMSIARPWWNRQHHREVTELPEEHRWGNHEWIVLNRKHAKMIVQDIHVIEVVSRHSHDQESYPSSLFSVQGCLYEIEGRMLTFVDWPLGNGCHPYTFKDARGFNMSLLKEAKQNGYLFARKIAKEFPESALMQLIDED